MKMAIPCFKRCRKPSSSSAISNGNKFSITCVLSCFSPFRRRNSSICHHNSAPVDSMMEQNEKLQIACKADDLSDPLLIDEMVDERLGLGWNIDDLPDPLLIDEMMDKRLELECNIDDLPDPLLMDILQRLPLNSVFRSKCVSKKWLTLICDPVFAKTYASHCQSLNRPFALFYIGFVPKPEYPCDIVPYCSTDGPESMAFPLNFFENELQKKQYETYSLQIVGVDNDLLLFSGLDEPHRDSYCVCNPLVFEWVALPLPARHQSRYPVVGFMVEDDGTFWVVQILSPESDLSRFLIFQVFCSRTGEWSSREVLCSRHIESFRAKRTFVYEGMIIWMVGNNLLAFDPKTDCSWFRTIFLPTNEKGSSGVSSGRLHYYEVNSYVPWEPIENPILRVWILTDFETGGWVLQHSIKYGHLWSSDDGLRHCLLVPKKQKKRFEWVCFHPFDSDVVFLRCDGQLIQCNLSSACLEVVHREMKKRNFLRLETDVLPLVFRSWPRTIAKNFKNICEASSS